ncbi:lasso peptide biosynthesis B2 protein [Streptomyces sp. BE147]|uniref:lasso peptide biosynthesis B2 protein n=1 Tax=Streptomyces sp. BE147 TaxID=3002524 RepID=UPI002E79E19F|nr:lasso peptide biosynthesis B2 protein [Streptomyces sp. BE147]MEE1741179.1 lasso peptide biosynthesis B2 protein [Streptomyces sp. BE147]
MSSPRMHYAVAEHGVALLDLRPYRGRWRFMDLLTAELWSMVRSGIPADQAIDALAERLAAQKNVSAARVRKDLSTVAVGLGRARLVAPARRTHGRPEPTVRFAGPVTVRFTTKAAAGSGLVLALVLLRCVPLRWAIGVANAATRLPGRTATATEADTMHATVRQAGRIWPGRSACLEESLGTFLAAALIGRRCRWVLGATFLPQGAHAWIEAEGSVVGQSEQDRVWPYTRVLEVERSN